jgi:excisionase family DNA binding protein
MTTDDHTWLTVPEVARELRVSVPTVWRWIRSGRLAASRIGVRSVRIRRTELVTTLVPTAAEAPQSDRSEALEDEYGADIEQRDQTLSADELLRRLRRHQQAMLRRRGGVPLPDSSPLIRQIREEHGDRL